jgi:hypothetical protein
LFPAVLEGHQGFLAASAGFLRVRSFSRFEVFVEGLLPQVIEGLLGGHV